MVKKSSKRNILDAIDRKILACLTQNARTPLLEIARDCGVSGAAIHQRVKKLEQSGIILGYQLDVDPKVLGFNVCTFIRIRISDPLKNMEAVERLKEIPEVAQCHFITGTFNLMIRVYCRDNEHFMATMFDHVLCIPGIAETETFVSLNCAFARSINVQFDTIK